MKNNFLTFILIILILGIIGGLGYFGLSYIGVDTENILSFVTGTNEVSNETIKPLEVTGSSSNTLLSAQIEQVKPVDSNINTQVSSGRYKYYYDQLDENAKIIYSAVESNIENLKTGTAKIDFGERFNSLLNEANGKEILNNAYQAALDAFSLDYPDVFYLDVTKMVLMIYSKTNIFGTKYTVDIEPAENANYLTEGFSSKADVDNALNRLDTIKDDVASQVANDDPYTKIKRIHDFLVEYIEYDTSMQKPNTRNIYGALVEKSVVCEGYAESLKFLLDAAGVPCIEVVGDGTNSQGQTESHAWNYVMLNDVWYAVDATWDDPTIIGGGEAPKSAKTRYFLKGENSFNKTHFPSGQVSDGGMIFRYPELSKEDYE